MKPFCVAVDWGTTSFRAWVVGEDGSIFAERRSEEGFVRSGEIGFAHILETHLQALDVSDDLPIIICGMAGATDGWQDAGYLDTPADLEQIANRALQISNDRDVRILCGVAQRDADWPDVMRGEETQLMGLIGTVRGCGLACLPGTHSKWVAFDRFSVQKFATFMSGDMFSVLAEHSILSLTMTESREIDPGDEVFLSSVERAIDAPAQVSNQLFTARASVLLGYGEVADSAAKLSGAMIGLEIAGALSRFGHFSRVDLVVSSHLGALYASALRRCDIEVAVHDGEELVRAGLLDAARKIWSSS